MDGKVSRRKLLGAAVGGGLLQQSSDDHHGIDTSDTSRSQYRDVAATQTELRGDWEFRTGEPDIITTPQLSAEFVHVQDEGSRLLALSQTDGTVEWMYSGSTIGSWSIVTTETTVYVIAADGELRALDAADGELLWDRSVEAAIETYALGDETLYLGETLYNSSIEETGGSIRAIATDDGTQQWQADFGTTVETLHVGTETLCFTTDNGSVGTLALDSGAQQWHESVESDISDVAIADSTVYIAAGTTARAISASEGVETWAVQMDAPIEFFAVGPETLHLMSTDSDAEINAITALAKTDGTRRWRESFDFLPDEWALAGEQLVVRFPDQVVSIAAMDGTRQWTIDTEESVNSIDATQDTVYIRREEVDSVGALIAIDQTDGRERWRTTFRDDYFSQPDDIILTETAIYLTSGYGDVRTFDITDGTPLWEHETGGSVQEIVATDESVYVGTDTGVLHSLSQTDGSERWQIDMGAKFFWGDVDVLHDLYVRNERLVFDLNETIYAVATDTGDTVWQHEHTSSDFGESNIATESVYFEQENTVIGVALADGTRQWESQPTDSSIEGIQTDGQTVFVRDSSTLYALAPADDTVEWTYDAEDVCLCATDETTAYLTTAEDGVVAVDRTDGSKNWSALGQAEVTTASVSGEFVFAELTNGVAALDTATGVQQWQVDIADVYYLRPGDESVYIRTEDSVHAVSADDGADQWTVNERHSILTVESDILYTVKGSRFARELVLLSADDGSERGNYLPTTGNVTAFAKAGQRIFVSSGLNSVIGIIESSVSGAADTLVGDDGPDEVFRELMPTSWGGPLPAPFPSPLILVGGGAGVAGGVLLGFVLLRRMLPPSRSSTDRHDIDDGDPNVEPSDAADGDDSTADETDADTDASEADTMSLEEAANLREEAEEDPSAIEIERFRDMFERLDDDDNS